MVSSRASPLSTASVVALVALGETFTGDTPGPEAEAGVVDGAGADDDRETAGSEATLEADWVRTGLVVIGVDNIGGVGVTEDDCVVVLAGGATDGVTVGSEVAEGLEGVCVAVS